MDTLKVSSKSNPVSVAGAIAGIIREKGMPAFTSVEVENETKTAMKLIVEVRK